MTPKSQAAKEMIGTFNSMKKKKFKDTLNKVKKQFTEENMYK